MTGASSYVFVVSGHVPLAFIPDIEWMRNEAAQLDSESSHSEPNVHDN